MKKKLSKISLFLSSIALSFGLFSIIESNKIEKVNAETTFASNFDPSLIGNIYTISFDFQGGSGIAESVIATYGEPLPHIIYPYKFGYHFKGYYTGVNGTGDQYFDEFGYSMANWDIAEDTTLYAKWEAQYCSVMFDKQGGQGGSNSIGVFYGEDLPRIDIPSKPGYDFRGYYSEPEGKGTKYYNADGTGARIFDFDCQTFFACWNISIYSIGFEKNNGVGGTSYFQITYGQNLPQIDIPSKSGYNFLGYYSEPKGKGTKYYNADGTSTKTWDKTESATLFAFWEFIGVDTKMKIAYDYATESSYTNTFRLLCEVDATSLKAQADEYDIWEHGIYIEKNGEYVANFDFDFNRAMICGYQYRDVSIYSEGDYKYILIDLGDLISYKSNAEVVFTISSYLEENGVEKSIKSTSYSFASLLDTYLDPSSEYYSTLTKEQIDSLEQCKSDINNENSFESIKKNSYDKNLCNLVAYPQLTYSLNFFSKDFISLTDGFCTVSKESTQSLISELFDKLSFYDRETFINTAPEIGRTYFTDEEIVLNAKSRYCYMISERGYDDFLGIFSEDELKALRSRGNAISFFYDSKESSSTILIISLVVIGFITLSGYFVLKKKENKQ